MFAGAKRSRLDVHRLQSGRTGSGSAEDLAALVLHLLDLFIGGGNDMIEFFQIFEEVADVEKCVAIEPDFDEGRLHAWQHACNTALVNASN